MTTTPQTQSDQVHLADFAAVIYRRRWLIVGGTLLGILLALTGRLLAPQKYEYRSIIEIGRLHNQHVEDLSEIGWTLRLLVEREGLLDIHRRYSFIERSELVATSLRLIGFSV
ncbi:Wzz/FepE/Etk N-terminal domain-containing protein [Pseudomonadota bacterium]